MENARLDESQAEVKIVVRNISSLTYADDTTLMAESEKRVSWLKVKEKNEKASLKLCSKKKKKNLQKTKIMASSPIIHGK